MENVTVEINPMVSALILGLIGLLYAVIQNAVNRRAQLTIDKKLHEMTSRITMAIEQKKMIYEGEVEAYKVVFRETSEYVESFSGLMGRLQAGVETGIFTFDRKIKQIEMHDNTIGYRKKVQIYFPFMAKDVVDLVSKIHNEGNGLIIEIFDLLDAKKVMTPKAMMDRLKPMVHDLETTIRNKVVNVRS